MSNQDEVVQQAQRSAEPLMAQPADATDPAAPQWVQDFPVDTEQDNYVARRDFTKFMVLTSCAFVAGQAWIGLKSIAGGRQASPTEKLVARVNEVAVGGALVFTYPEEHDPCLLMRLSEAEFVAYSQKCTHLSCAVVPGPKRTIQCPCHGGVFDSTNGKPIAGPPRRPLPKITLQFREGVIYATGVELSTV